MTVVDYSWARPSPEALRAAGFVGAIRYVSPDRTGKNIDAAERDRLRGAGLALTLNWESTTHRALEGWAAGRQDALDADRMADALGYPPNAAIYWSCDTYATADQVRPYYQGVAANARRPVGAYGGSRAIVPLLNERIVAYYWQAKATSWSDRYPHPQAHLVQQVRTSNPAWDENVEQVAAYGQWHPDGTVGARPGAPQPRVKGTTTRAMLIRDSNTGAIWLLGPGRAQWIPGAPNDAVGQINRLRFVGVPDVGSADALTVIRWMQDFGCWDYQANAPISSETHWHA